MKVLFNGDLLSINQTSFNEKGWLPGSGIFETIRTRDSKPWALSRHMRRVVNSAIALKIKLPNEELLRVGISQLLDASHNNLGMLRLSFDHGGTWGAVHFEYQKNDEPARVSTYTTAVHGSSIKSYPYDHRLHILEEVQAVGMDEALVINHAGRICEGSVSNLLLRINGRWCTPPISDGALPGIVRALVVENFDVSVKSIPREAIGSIESGFLLSSLRIARPIESIDGRQLSQSPEFKAEIEAMCLRTSVG